LLPLQSLIAECCSPDAGVEESVVCSCRCLELIAECRVLIAAFRHPEPAEEPALSVVEWDPVFALGLFSVALADR